jgi:hypothetical protein
MKWVLDVLAWMKWGWMKWIWMKWVRTVKHSHRYSFLFSSSLLMPVLGLLANGCERLLDRRIVAGQTGWALVTLLLLCLLLE